MNVTPQKQEKETWDLYDANEVYKGTFTKGKGMIPPNLYHKTVEVIPTDMEGHLLLTRRSMRKKTGAGQLEFPAGSVLSGETEMQAAIRELKEETGLTPKKIYHLQKARTKGIIRYTFLAYIPDLLEQPIQCPETEVMSYQLVTYDEWQGLLFTQEYNAFRLACYNDKLFDLIKTLVHKYADETQCAPKHGLKQASALSYKQPKHLDKRCYEEDPPEIPDMADWEPTVERGDDGTW